MCVIIVCPKGVEKPSNEVLSSIKRLNPHGFGLVSDTKFYKTLNFNVFLKKLNEVDKDENLIIHMRYATHGSIKTGNCHPFKCRGLYFAHNGVLPIESVNDMTDSEIAFKNQLYPCFREFGFESKQFDEVCRRVAGCSKFAFLYKGQLKLIGDYYKLNGVYYSNIFDSGLMYDNCINVVNM